MKYRSKLLESVQDNNATNGFEIFFSKIMFYRVLINRRQQLRRNKLHKNL